MLRIVRRLRGTPKPNQQAEQDEEDNIPRVDNWTNSTSRLQVTSEPKSGTCTVSLRAKARDHYVVVVIAKQQPSYSSPHTHPSKHSSPQKVDLPPDLLYNILTSPQNSVIFHGIKRTVDRKVIYQGPSRQTVDVVQEGQWRFLMFRGVFTTRLRVEEDKHTRTVVFRQTHPGFMKAFEGRWQLAPFTQETLDELYDVEHKHKWLGLRKAVAALEHCMRVWVWVLALWLLAFLWLLACEHHDVHTCSVPVYVCKPLPLTSSPTPPHPQHPQRLVCIAPQHP